MVISLWDSVKLIKAFAGPDYQKAGYYPEDRKFLLKRNGSASEPIETELPDAPSAQQSSSAETFRNVEP